MAGGGDRERPPFSESELDHLALRIDDWLARQRRENETVAAVDRGAPGERRWYVRLSGEQKSTFTIWFTLGQRTLHYETYVMPGPEENHERFYEHLLRRNLKLYGASFAIGEEDALFLVGQLGNEAVDELELDRVLGSLYAYVEQFFRPALEIGFASRVGGEPSASPEMPPR
jgi:Putative bacterial sensory transduction regulator